MITIPKKYNPLTHLNSGFKSAESSPLMGFKFFVEIAGLATCSFSEVSGIEAEIEVDELKEGGENNFVHRFPRTTHYPDLVLTRGMISPASEQLWLWYRSAMEGKIIKRSVFIVPMGEDDSIQPTQVLFVTNAWPKKYIGPRLSANDKNVAIQSLVLVHEGLGWV